MARHSAQVPYNLLHGTPSDACRKARTGNLPWATLLQVRSWCRLRAGLLVLRHVSKRCSKRRFQQCIFCNCSVRNATVHCVARCTYWRALRHAIAVTMDLNSANAGQFTLAVLKCAPSDEGFNKVAELSAALDKGAHEFWSSPS